MTTTTVPNEPSLRILHFSPASLDLDLVLEVGTKACKKNFHSHQSTPNHPSVYAPRQRESALTRSVPPSMHIYVPYHPIPSPSPSRSYVKPFPRPQGARKEPYIYIHQGERNAPMHACIRIKRKRKKAVLRRRRQCIFSPSKKSLLGNLSCLALPQFVNIHISCLPLSLLGIPSFRPPYPQTSAFSLSPRPCPCRRRHRRSNCSRPISPWSACGSR